jgi:glutamine amidotransferase
MIDEFLAEAAEVAIIDYGVGNLRSVEKAFAAGGCRAIVTGDTEILRQAKRLVLPGVGAFAACMKALREHDLETLVRERVSEGAPILGVCVGMQMLFEESEEFGTHEGLGLLPGRVRRFDVRLHVPQTGWNQVHQRRDNSLFEGVENDSFFYFVHSYYCDAGDKDIIAGETEYGITYPSVVAHDNIAGVQFHPEKSQSAGLRVLRNFAERIVTSKQ